MSNKFLSTKSVLRAFALVFLAACGDDPVPLGGTYDIVFEYADAPPNTRDIGVLFLLETDTGEIFGTLELNPPHDPSDPCDVITILTGNIGPPPVGSTDPDQVIELEVETTGIAGVQCARVITNARVRDGRLTGNWQVTKGPPGALTTSAGTFVAARRN